MKKKLTMLLCMLFICVTILPANSNQMFLLHAAEHEGETYIYFKNQLNTTEKKFYESLESLYTSGKMKTGTGQIDISEKFTQTELKNYANGSATLAQSFQAARDAFMQDYGEIFYVDFTKVSMRLGMQNQKYILQLGNGSYVNYYEKGFSSVADVDAAIQAVTQVKNEIEESIKTNVTDEIKNSDANIVTSVHNALIERLDYTYPNSTDAGMQVRGIYGLVNGKTNCQGYSKLMKWILQDYNISTILVSGIGINSKQNSEEHMWNYVYINNGYYAVDTTWDDPITTVKANDSIRNTYLLRGSDTMQVNHSPQGILSLGGKEFKYPDLFKYDYDTSYNNEELGDFNDESTDLKVLTEKVTSGNSVSTLYTISYKGMNMDQLAKKGLYLAGRFAYVDADSKKVTFEKWVPISNYVPENFESNTEQLLAKMNISTTGTIQFCLTPISDKENANNNKIYYKEDLSLLENHTMITKQLLVPYSTNYVVPPFIRTSSPTLTETQLANETKHYSVQFTEKLKITDDSNSPKFRIDNTVNHIQASVNNATFKDSSYSLPDGTIVEATTVEFDFTADTTFQGILNIYSLQIENMVGIKSNKQPNAIPIRTTIPMKLPCPIQVAHGAIPNAFVIANPLLVMDDKVEAFTTDGGITSTSLNISLIATKKADSEKNVLDQTLSDNLGVDISNKLSSTFDLALGCQSLRAAIRKGYNVTVGIPYPEGFHPEDYEDVEFRAYHFRYDEATKKYIPEEIVCQITPQGLIVIANDFSPFTVVAVEKGTIPQTMTNKTVAASAETGGGSITTANGGAGLYALESKETRSFTVTADNGYEIEKITVNGEAVNLPANATSYTANFAYDNMDSASSVKAYFVAKTVAQSEAEQNIETVLPDLIPEDAVIIKPSPDTGEELEYLTQTLNDTKTGVSVAGNLLKDVKLTVAGLDNDSDKAIKSNYSSFTPVNGFQISFDKDHAFKGNLSVVVPVDSKYNGKTLTLVSYDKTKEGSEAYQTQKVEVKDGKITVTLSALLPSMIMDESQTPNKDDQETPTPTPAPGETTTDGEDLPDKKGDSTKKPETGDQTNKNLLFATAFIALDVMAIAYVVNKRKKRQ